MKRQLTRCLALAAALTGGLAYPLHSAEPAGGNVDDIVARYTTARGGLERWRATQGLVLQGRFTSFSRDEAFTARWQRPNLYRFESVQQGRPLAYAQDTTGPWWQVGLYGHGWPQRTPAPDKTQLAREAELEPALLDYTRKGHQVKFLGRGEVDGTPTIQLELTHQDGAVETWHLDAATHLEVAIDSKVFDYTQIGEPVGKRTYFSDFRPVDGLMIPHRVEAEYKARYTSLVVHKAETTVTGPAESFRLPLAAGMEALRLLAGRWKVKMEIQPNPRAPWQTVEFDSVIEAIDEGALLEERFAFSHPAVGTLAGRRWHSWDRTQERFRVLHYDDSANEIKVLEGPLEGSGDERRAVVSGPAVEGQPQERWTTHHLGADSFQLDAEVSSDGGKTWTAVAKHTYTRAAG